MEKTYIALDLETTGFDPVADQVLEIAAVKFQGDQILETFETLIRPGLEIPPMVSHITGITAETVRDAPSFEAVRENLIVFLGNLPIVGHNIEFDLTFLEAKGIPILSPQLDTLKLATILFPELPSHSLDTISRQLKIPHQQKHRALSDALVCVRLFKLLQEKIDEIPSPTMAEIHQLVQRGTWDLAELFLQSSGHRLPPPSQAGRRTVSTQKTAVMLPNAYQSSAAIGELLGPTSPLSQILDFFEFRPGQQTLFAKIAAAAENGHHLLAEAGTGTGKTMAYLLAAAALRRTSGKKTIISTYTNNLQDQIVNKDFPLIQKIFPDLTIAVLKGRRKYLDLSKLQTLKEKPVLEEHEITSLIKILLWLGKTESGDLDELNLQNKETLIFEQICSEPDRQEHGYLEKARAKAEQADIVVVNHALLVQDGLSVNGILPAAELLIIDEAHHLEKTITDAQTVTFSENRLIHLWERFSEDFLEKTRLTPDQSTKWNDLLEKLREQRLISLEHNQKIFRSINLLMQKFASAPQGTGARLSLDGAISEDLQWTKARDNLDELDRSGQETLSLCREITRLSGKEHPADEAAESALRHLENFFQQLAFFKHNSSQQITWISQNFDNSLHLATAPLTVDQTFHEAVSDKFSSVTLTSATLSTYGNFNYLRHELGLGENYQQILIPSHFSYPDQVKIIIPEDLSDPRDPRYLAECGQIISSTVKKNGGRTLVLFTAKKDLARVFHDLAPDLKTTGIDLLAQNISGGRGKILAHFQDDPERSAILGTNSFWEGVDLIGPVLTCVIIQKLPFDPPDDPIIKSRSARFNKPFEEYSLPRAILRFKQGFGRLIRSASDTGAVIILDSRLVQKSYGREFISSLPQGIKIHQCRQDEVTDYLS